MPIFRWGEFRGPRSDRTKIFRQVARSLRCIKQPSRSLVYQYCGFEGASLDVRVARIANSDWLPRSPSQVRGPRARVGGTQSAREPVNEHE